MILSSPISKPETTGTYRKINNKFVVRIQKNIGSRKVYDILIESSELESGTEY